MPPCAVASRHVDLRRIARPIGALILRFRPLTEDRRVRVAIFEDTPFVLDLYLEAFSRIRGIDIRTRSTVGHPDEALACFRRTRPRIVLTDLALNRKAELDGFTILRSIKGESPDTAVALSTSYSPLQHGGLHDRIAAQPFDAVFNKADLYGIGRFIEGKANEFRLRGPAPPDVLAPQN